MKNFLSLCIFIFAVAGGFVYLGNSIPQIKQGAAGPVTITLTVEGLTEAGKSIFERENSCLTCHSLGEDPKARCPNMIGVGERASQRKPGMSAAEYFMESVYSPDAFVVEGYPKGQMKPVNRPPASLNDDEIVAVTAYLYSLGGNFDQDAIQKLATAQEKYKKFVPTIEVAEAEFLMPEAYPEDGFDVFNEMKCWQCHKAPGFEDKEPEKSAPDLHGVAAMQDAEYFYDSIVFPNKVIVKGEGYVGEDGRSIMPEFHDSLTLRQLYSLIAFLQTLK
ncbi:MAG TPA: c-type cytochrome [Candidatus Brocadiia bacterium]|nr:c-type cytochrome [Candidatus Brocadiales bacterium]